MPRPVGSVRPGGRTARTRAAVLDATRAELLRGGYGQLTIERVAVRAGVHKTTIYRRWESRTGLLTDLLHSLAGRAIVLPDTGRFDKDLHIYARSLAATLASENGRMLGALLAARQLDPTLSRWLDEVFTFWFAAVTELTERAVQRGEVPPGTSSDSVIRAVAAPLYYQLMVRGAAPTEGHADQAAAAAIIGARAGLHARR